MLHHYLCHSPASPSPLKKENIFLCQRCGVATGVLVPLRAARTGAASTAAMPHPAIIAPLLLLQLHHCSQGSYWPAFHLLIMSKSYDKWEGGQQYPLQKFQTKEYDVIKTLWNKPGSLYFGHWYQEWQEREREVHSFYWHQNEEIKSKQKVMEKFVPYIQMFRPVSWIGLHMCEPNSKQAAPKNLTWPVWF